MEVKNDKKIDHIQGDVKVLKNDVGVLKKDVKVLKGDVSILKKDVLIVKRDMGDLKGELTELKKDVATRAKQETVDLIAAQVVKNTDDIAEMKEAIATKLATKQEMYAGFDQVITILRRIEHELVSHTAHLNRHDKEIVLLKRKVGLAA